MSQEPIPLVDLKAQHAEIAAEVARGFESVFAGTAFILGAEVAAFERSFAAYCGVANCIGVGNGTDAIELAVRALGLSEGDEVLVPANTFIATALGVLRAGVRPVPVDCDRHFLMDPLRIEERITSRTKAILPVHLFGQMADMEVICDVAAGHRLAVIEDAAQSQGAKRHGHGSGGFGDAAATSFYPGKNLGAYGDAGAVLTRRDDLAERVRQLRNWGSDRKYHHPVIGFNSRLDTLQAVVLSAKLRRLEGWNAARRQAAGRYDELLAGMAGVEAPRTLEGNLHVHHLYVVRVQRRDEVLKRLHAEGIGAGIHYPTPLHLHVALRHLGYHEGDFPAAEHAAAEILSLPLHPHLTSEQQVRVVDCLRRAVGR
jgi:dTDP-4-amino-4,6-dideoxygalactose transaminase